MRQDWARSAHICAKTGAHRIPQVSVLNVRKGTLDLGKPPPPLPAQSLSTAPLVARTRNGGVGYGFPKVRSIRSIQPCC